jgi:hypothetical protein
METLGNENQQKTSKKYWCKICNYYTSRKCNYDEHLLTAKHNKNEIGNTLETFGNENQQKTSNSKYSCKNCNKEFKNRSGLWKHNKKCKNGDIKTKISDEIYDKELILMLIKENSEFKNMMMEQSNIMLKAIENGTHNTNSHNTTTTTNSHNKSFNLQFFLNETCKDAMNIMDFVNSIQLQLSDLERVGKLGYVEGISNIITTNLKALDVTQRPIHCTDKERSTICKR